MSKPYITCLMECSVDGRLDRKRWSTLYGTDHATVSTIYYETLNNLRPDGNLIGMNTAAAFFQPPRFIPNTKENTTEELVFFRGIRDEVKLTAVFDFQGCLAYKNNKLSDSNIIVITGRKTVNPGYLRYLREHEISYTFAGDDGSNVQEALNSLHDHFGLHNLVLEGGGTLNGSFLKAGLIDELVVLIYPGLDGLSGIKSIFEYKGKDLTPPSANQSLELMECVALSGGMVKLHYKLHKVENKSHNEQLITGGIACAIPK